MTTAIDLSQFCNDNGSPITKRPFAFGEYDAATDGYAILFVPVSSHFHEPLADKANNAYIRSIAKACRAASRAIPLGALRDWCGEITPPAVCTQCNGSNVTQCFNCTGRGVEDCSCKCGLKSHQTPCEDCGGSGAVPCDCSTSIFRTNPGTLEGLVVDRNRLRTLLAVMAGDVVKVRANIEERQLYLCAGNAMAVLMGMNFDYKINEFVADATSTQATEVPR